MKKVISIMLALVMVLGLMSVGTMAAVGDVIMSDNFENYSANGGELTVGDYWSRSGNGFSTGYGDTGYSINMNYETSRASLEQNYKQKVTIPAGIYTFSAKIKANRVVDEGVTVTPKIALGASNSFTDTNTVKFDAVQVTTEWQTVGGRFSVPTDKTLVAQAIGFHVEGKVSELTIFQYDDVQIVEAAPIYNVVTEYDSTKGSVVASAEEFTAGESFTFTATPNEGYYVAKVLVNEAKVAPVGGVYTVSGLESDAEIVVTFVANPAEGTVVLDNFEQYADIAEVRTSSNYTGSDKQVWSRNDALEVEENGNQALKVLYATSRNSLALNYRNEFTVPAGSYNLTARVKADQVLDGVTLVPKIGATTYDAVTYGTDWSTVNIPVTFDEDTTFTYSNNIGFTMTGKPSANMYFFYDDVMFVPTAPVTPPAPEAFDVVGTTNNAAFGTVAASAATSEGEAVTFTVTPKLGYYVAAATLNGENVLASFDAYTGGTYTVEEVTEDVELAVEFAAVTAKGEDVATLPAVFAPAADTAVTFGKVLDTTNATSWGIELTKDGVGVTPANGGSYLYKALATNANGQYAIEFVGLEAGTYQIRSYVYVNGEAVFGAPATFVVAE